MDKIEVKILNGTAVKEAEKNTNVAISTDNIIVGRSLSMPEEKYYVLYYETKDEEVMEKYGSIVATYLANSSSDKTKLYTVDMSDALNKKYAAKESNTKPNNESEEKTLGSISFVPSVAGLIIAGEVIKDIINN